MAKKKRSKKFKWVVIVSMLLAGFFLWVLANSYTVIRIEGSSMEDTMQDGEYWIATRIRFLWDLDETNYAKDYSLGAEQAYAKYQFLRDLVVVVEHEREGRIVKRVKGVSGDLIELDPERNKVTGMRDLIINGHLVLEDYETATLPARDLDHYRFIADWGAQTVPKNEVFLVGDNPQESRDSRAYGYVYLKDVKWVVERKAPDWLVGILTMFNK